MINRLIQNQSVVYFNKKCGSYPLGILILAIARGHAIHINFENGFWTWSSKKRTFESLLYPVTTMEKLDTSLKNDIELAKRIVEMEKRIAERCALLSHEIMRFVISTYENYEKDEYIAEKVDFLLTYAEKPNKKFYEDHYPAYYYKASNIDHKEMWKYCRFHEQITTKYKMFTTDDLRQILTEGMSPSLLEKHDSF